MACKKHLLAQDVLHIAILRAGTPRGRYSFTHILDFPWLNISLSTLKTRKAA